MYSAIVEDLEAFRHYLDEEIAQHPELFPVAIAGGYRFYGMRYSQKQQLRHRAEHTSEGSNYSID